MSHRAGSLVALTAVLAIAVLATAGRVHAAALTPQEEKLVAVNVIEGEVIDTVYLGSFLDGQVRAGAHAITVQIDHYERLVPGQKVFLTFEPEHGLCLNEPALPHAIRPRTASDRAASLPAGAVPTEGVVAPSRFERVFQPSSSVFLGA